MHQNIVDERKALPTSSGLSAQPMDDGKIGAIVSDIYLYYFKHITIPHISRKSIHNTRYHRENLRVFEEKLRSFIKGVLKFEKTSN